VIVAEGKLAAKAGSGRFLPRTGGEPAAPTGVLAPEMDPKRNFGAKLY
jgi:dihydropyrimidinase